jgi:hypothetical protein
MKCQCDICKRSEQFKIHLNKIEDAEAKEFFINLFDHLYIVEDELANLNFILDTNLQIKQAKEIG